MIRALHNLFKEWTTEVDYRENYPSGYPDAVILRRGFQEWSAPYGVGVD